MAEITPITPYSPVQTIYKVERDEPKQRPPRKPPQPKPESQPDSDKQPAEHIDEIV